MEEVRLLSITIKTATYTHVGRCPDKSISNGIDEFAGDSKIAYLDFSS